jgi:uncharacterized protein (DUF1697 family)
VRYAALLRGVNLVKRNRIAMAELRQILAGLGYQDVATYLQSGNAVFRSDDPAGQLEQDIAAALARHAGLSCAVMVRTGIELAAVQEANPLGREPGNAARFFVSFLADVPAPGAAADFANLDLEPERAWVIGRETYFWCPDGLRQSKLTSAFLETRLGVAGTARNWNTVTRLAELTLAGA